MNAPLNPIEMLVNATVRRLENLFPGYFQNNTKRDTYIDFGYPKTLTTTDLVQMYQRNGIATAGVDQTVGKTWEDLPMLRETEGVDELTDVEQAIKRHFGKLRLWSHLRELDKRGMVGGWSGLIYRFADSKPFKEPVESVPGGLEGLVEVIPAWLGQLTVTEYESDETSENFGRPKMFHYNQMNLDLQNDGNTSVPRNQAFEVHPSRVLVWSDDGTTFAPSALAPGYNALIDIEKVCGGGAEGFWKAAKEKFVLEIDKEANIDQMASAMGVAKDKLVEKINEQVKDYQQGFDATLMLQGMNAKNLGITLPSPEHFMKNPLMVFAASLQMPMKILVGSQTGERASTEDASEWEKTIKSRRTNATIPNIVAMIDQLTKYGVLNDDEWFVHWADITESSIDEKMDRSKKMTEMNESHVRSGGNDLLFAPEEIREVSDFTPVPKGSVDLGDDEDDEGLFDDDEEN